MNGPPPVEVSPEVTEYQVQPDTAALGVQVQMRFAAVAGVAHLAEQLPGVNLITGADGDPRTSR
jgi:hypothetical protein